MNAVHASSSLQARHADHRILRDNTGELLLRPAHGLGRLHRQHHVASIRGGIPYPDLRLGRQVETHLPEHRSRLANYPGAVLEILVPIRWQSDESEGGA